MKGRGSSTTRRRAMSSRRRGGWTRAVLRFVASVMVVSGVLLLADAGVTLAWQEPISSLLASRQQAKLGDELDRRARPAADGAADFRRLAAREARRLRTGDPIGRIAMPSLDRSYVMVHGVGQPTLRKGPGHYPDTPLPGQGGTVAVAGHRTTYLAPFRAIDELRPGDPIVLSMTYGRFTYRVERTRIVKPSNVGVKRKVGYEQVILTACHPVYSAKYRIVVFARLVKAAAVT